MKQILVVTAMTSLLLAGAVCRAGDPGDGTAVRAPVVPDTWAGVQMASQGDPGDGDELTWGQGLTVFTAPNHSAPVVAPKAELLVTSLVEWAAVWFEYWAQAQPGF